MSNNLAKTVAAVTNAAESHWEWLGVVGGCLHYVPAMRRHGAYERFRDGPTRPLLLTACRREMRMFLPGVMNRLSAKRCDYCCDALGIPRGYGTPGNELARKTREAP